MTNGRPGDYFSGLLSKAWTAHMKACGLYHVDKSEKLELRDLRGTAVTLLSEAGCGVPQIVSITGHTLQSAHRILEKYLARTEALSQAAIHHFENATATAFANHECGESHNRIKTDGKSIR